MQQYSVNQHHINTLLNWVQSRDIAIPEIQRPFIWSTIKVRDLIDSLYQGYPIGYIIVWKNPDVKLKDGTRSSGKKVLIDGQQRITALRAAILGESIINKDYKEQKIQIAFHPVEGKFETLTPAIKNDRAWIPDISKFMVFDAGLFGSVNAYCNDNPNTPREIVERNIERLLGIKHQQVGLIELEATLDIETVTEIFIRINSQGVVLSQADFAMSKIASYDQEDNFGTNLRKCIDYFCHLAKEPNFYRQISENDSEFSNTHYLSKIAWLKNENDDLYDPDYSDVLRVSFTKEFQRGRMSDLVSLLSGRNFKTREFEQAIVEESFQKLNSGVLDFVNETNFKRFVMIMKSAGFIDSGLIRSQNAINFAYILYLTLRDQNENSGLIEKYVQKWLVMSILTGRYSGSPESMYDFDIKKINSEGIEKYLKSIEEAELSETFWNTGLINLLDRSLVSSPIIKLFFATQVKNNDKGFLSSDITVSSLISHRGDIHHIFPKEFLKKKFNSRGDYNQIANFAYAQQEINIKIGKKSPHIYMQEVVEQCKGGDLKYGNITELNELYKNLETHCIPREIVNMEIDDYKDFLEKRKRLIAVKIKEYYQGIFNPEESENQGTNFSELTNNGEDDFVEFKSSLRWDYQQNTINKKMEYVIAKAIASFLNSEGGRLIIGIDDQKKVLGLEKDYATLGVRNNSDGFLLKLVEVVNNFIGKEYHAYITAKVIKDSGKDICVIDILKSGKPAYVINEGREEFYIRAAASSQPLSVREASEYTKNHWANV